VFFRVAASLTVLAATMAVLSLAAPVAASQGLPTDFVIVRFEQDAGTVSGQAPSTRAPSLEEQGYRRLGVPGGMSASEFAAMLRDDPAVLSAEPDAPVFAAAIPDDSFYSRDQSGYLNSIGVPDAWDLATGSDEVVVAVLDSGIDRNHPDLAPRLWVNQAEIPANGIDDDNNGCIDDVNGCRLIATDPSGNGAACGYTATQSTPTGNIQDDNGVAGANNHSHGTLVAGIIGAAGNNGAGVAGVAWNVRLMSVKVLDCGGPAGGGPRGSMSDVARGIDYARRMGADIINLSLASAAGDEKANLEVLRTAIQQAEAEGIIIIAAAGNSAGTSNPQPGYPAAYTQYQNVIGVGASVWESGQTWASYSSYGPGVDFAAPGNGIASTVRVDLSPGAPPYASVEKGTSFSTPLVAGMFALMKSRNSKLPMQGYLDIARDTASPAPTAPHGGNWAGAGIIDVGAAVARIPMLLTGSVQHDWIDLPAGTPVVARVKGKICGEAVSESFGVVSRYSLRIASAQETPGCGAPGESVIVYVGGSAGVPTVPWGGKDQDLGKTGVDVSSVTPPPGPLVLQPIGAGWNNIAHLDPNGELPGALSYLPASWTAALRWDPEMVTGGGLGGYERLVRNGPGYVNTWPRISRYDAFWVDATGTTNVATVNPDAQQGRNEFFSTGWNNFAYTGQSKKISDALQGIAGKYSQVLRYDNVTGQWQSYIPGQSRFLNGIGGLLTMQVYWIYMEEPAGIAMN
jgi:subtilisin family serine protease